jgi:branched-chain amino acid transport system ATP-binding protein
MTGAVARNALVIEHLRTAYDKADVLEDVSLTVRPGTITCLLGSNGAGKTTLIRSILGLTPARSGRIAFGDVDVTRLPTHRVVAQGIACIPEGRKVFPRLTVEENLALGAYLERDDRVIAQRLARVYATFPHLGERRRQLAGTMSGGEQAMVSIGRGLMSAPELLLVDEPSLGLSPRLVQENFAVLRRIHEQGITLFLVEQNVHQTLAIAQHGYVLSKGRVVTSGSAAELLANEEVHAAYFGHSAGRAPA